MTVWPGGWRCSQRDLDSLVLVDELTRNRPSCCACTFCTARSSDTEPETYQPERREIQGKDVMLYIVYRGMTCCKDLKQHIVRSLVFFTRFGQNGFQWKVGVCFYYLVDKGA